MVAAGLDPARPFQDSVRGDGDPARPARDARADPQAFAERQGSGVDRRADHGVGIAVGHRVRRRDAPGEGDLAARQGGAGPCAFARRRDARRLPGAAAGLPGQLSPPGAQDRVERGGRGGRRADRSGLGARAQDLRQGRPVPVRPLQRRRRDVRAGRQPPPHLRRSGLAADARVHGGGDGAAGVESLGRRRRGGRHGASKNTTRSEPAPARG